VEVVVHENAPWERRDKRRMEERTELNIPYQKQFVFKWGKGFH